MSSQPILNLLQNYEPFNEQQASQKTKMMSFIKGNPSCFESAHPPLRGTEPLEDWGHITGSAWVLSPDKKSVLLTHHKKLNMWLQLGGHSDGEPNVMLTSLREAKEESGIQEIEALSQDIFDIDIHTFPEKKGLPAHLHYDIRFCFQSKTLDFQVSEESHNLKWMPLNEINSEQFDASVYRMALKSL